MLMSLNDSITGDGMVCQPIGYMKPDDKNQLERSEEVRRGQEPYIQSKLLSHRSWGGKPTND